MTGWITLTRRLVALSGSVMLTATGCAFGGINSLPLPGAVGRGSGATTFHVEIANISTLESNSPVLIDDVVVGSVGKMTVKNGHADVEVSLQPGAFVPANAVASVGQTSLLGSMHIALDPPLGQTPTGRLQPGATIALNQSSTYPSTEQTLSALSVVLNAGGLGQVGDVIHNFNAAFSGREAQIRDLLSRLNDVAGTFDDQRDNVIATIQSLERVSATFAAQDDVIARALNEIPPALDVLTQERPRLTTALTKLGNFSDLTTRLVNDSQADLVKNLQNLQPTIKALADVGPDLAPALAYSPTFPLSQSLIDRGIRGDYYNVFALVDLTVPRLKRTLFLGTRWGEEHAELTPVPGDPWYRRYTYDPLDVGIAPPPADSPLPTDAPPSDAPPPPGIPAGSDGHDPAPVAPPPDAPSPPPAPGGN